MEQQDTTRGERSVTMQRFRLPADRELLTMKEAAHFLRVTARTASRWCRSGHIPGVKIGHTWRIHKSDLLRIIVPHRDPPCPQPTADGV